MSHATAPNPVLPFTSSLLSCSEQSFGAAPMDTAVLRSVQMLKREWGAESNGKPPHLFIPSKTAALVPEFAMEDVPLVRTLMMMMYIKNIKTT